MEALAPAPVGSLEGRLDNRWVPRQIRLDRGGGLLQLTGRPRGYRWQASRLPLDGLQLALGPQERRQPLQGRLSGQGVLELQPLAFNGTAQLERPIFLGVLGQSAQLSFRYANRRYQAQASLAPLAGGTLAIDWSGLWQGAFRARLEGRDLSTLFLQQLVRAWPQWRGEGPAIIGRASDIGTLLIDTFGGSVDGQLRALAVAQSRLALARAERISRQSPQERLQQVEGRFDADLRLGGPTLLEARADLEARAHLWRSGADQDQALTQVPVVVRFQGPLRRGAGDFNLANLPLELLALLTPVPASLRGSVSVGGRYRLGGPDPELTLNLSLAPLELRSEHPEHCFEQLLWTDRHPPETFRFWRVLVRCGDSPALGGWIYQPDPQTKQRHGQPPQVVEVLAPPLEGIAPGVEIALGVDPHRLWTIDGTRLRARLLEFFKFRVLAAQDAFFRDWRDSPSGAVDPARLRLWLQGAWPEALALSDRDLLATCDQAWQLYGP
jgi:hypothetical protein